MKPTFKLFEGDILDIVTLSVLREWIAQVEERALTGEGIYRKSGTKSKIDTLTKLYDEAKPVNLADYPSDVVSCTMKQYLRTLKEPITTFNLYDDFLATHSLPSNDERAQHLKEVLSNLPNLNYIIIRYVVAHLVLVSQNQERNLMTPSNLGMVFGPVFFRKDASDSAESAMVFLQDLSKLSACVKFMIENYEEVFEMSVEDAHKLDENEYDEQWRENFVHGNGGQKKKELALALRQRTQEPPAQMPLGGGQKNNGSAPAPHESQQSSSAHSPLPPPPPPTINIQKAQEEQEKMHSPRQNGENTTTATTTTTTTNPNNHHSTDSPPHSPEHHRFNIVSTPERIEDGDLSPVTTGIGDESVLLSPRTPAPNKPPHHGMLTPISPQDSTSLQSPPAPIVKQIGKATFKRSHSEFCHMLTTNPIILSILSNSNIIGAAEIPSMAKKLYKVSSNLGTTAVMLRELLNLEFNAHQQAGSKSTGILRANNLLTKLLDEMVREEGHRYLRKSIKKHLLFIIDTDNAKIVLNTKDIKIKSKTQKQAILERNRQKLVALVDLFTRAIMNERSMKKMPDNLKFVCTSLREMATERQLPVANTVANFVMLRMFNPVIVNPESLNISSSSGRPITVDQKKIFIMVSKVLQKIANQMHFNKADQDMYCMNTVVDKHVPQFSKFMERVGFTHIEMQRFKHQREAVVASNVQLDSVARDTQLVPLVKDIHTTLVAREESVAKEEGFKKVTFDHLLYLYPGTQRTQPELVAMQKTDGGLPLSHGGDGTLSSRHSGGDKQHDTGEGDFLLPLSELSIDLDRPLETLEARIDDCRRKQGITVIPDVLTMTNLQLVLEKQLLKRELHKFDVDFESQRQKPPTKRDKEPLRSVYQRYKHVRLVMSSKGLSYSREIFDKIAMVAQLEEPLVHNATDREGKKRSKYSLNQLTTDAVVAERLKHDPEYNKVRNYKREVQKLLHQYQDYFERKNGRKIRTRYDRDPMKRYYDIYKFLKHELVRLCEEHRDEMYGDMSPAADSKAIPAK
mmetsp:Transcript_5683/g.21429  ORF Transcript_5683/g.21429 Transcript_5683/m.21429 type:complete len:1024 (-) Transcript_5683:620-3691(-)|eukprot:CAMPEP_0117444662 /NCGR_PEP_ID=MMETSP0759-20121206/5361_1 /TAXON_ID=63605 /ORGANISM="Percolomonas cosmopolitus, Strain WS" /LENGTH=1023 /DNA_ID=CAMNT_0005236745 /DNA_START=237 /DNA_END=3308 /DNA_ORIENTATION=-